MSGEVKNLEVHVVEKIKVGATLTVKRHCRLIKRKPIEYSCCFAIVIISAALSNFLIFPWYADLIMDVIVVIAWGIWGDPLVEKIVKGINKLKKK